VGQAGHHAAEFVRCLDEPNSDREAQRIEEVAMLMRQRMAENIRVPDLAHHMQCSTDYFRRIFNRRMGLPPSEYLAGLRLQHAMQLLEHSDLPVSQIAHSSGYLDSFYFSRLFRLKVGCSPLEFRRQIRP
jgi:AraC family transcriptional regulator